MTVLPISGSAGFLPQVSVIIPVYNGADDLPDLLQSLQAQTYPADRVEYLIVDNASRDRTRELLQAAVLEWQQQGLQLHCLSETQIQSSYAARNTGIRAATGEILAFTDADCRPDPHWLEQLVQPFTNPAIGIVAGEILALPGHTLLEQHAEREGTLSQKHTLAHPFYPYGQTANLAIRRSALTEAGLFRAHLTTGGDADLCWRIQQTQHWQIYFAESATIKHRHRSTWQELQSQWRRYGRSNRYLHELHGVALMRDFKRKEYVYRWSRWFLKELPLASLQAIAGKAGLVDLVATPIGLLCNQARSTGQREAQLPEAARQIEWLSTPALSKSEDLVNGEVSDRLN